MGAQKKVKKSNESINSRLALVMKSGKVNTISCRSKYFKWNHLNLPLMLLIPVCAGIQADPENAEEWEEQAGDHCQQHSPFEEVSHWQYFA